MTDKRADVIESTSPERAVYEQYPQWLKDRLEWFRDLRFGLFLHWGPYCQWGCIESWPLVEQDTWARPDDLQPWVERGRDLERFRRDYWALNQTFNPTEFNPENWAAAAEYAGMRYVNFTTKHHDGFCMFDTATTDYRVTHPSCPFHSHPRADIARHVFDAFRERDFGISCYFSKSDWHSPFYWRPERPAHDRHPNYDTHAEPEVWEQFVGFVHAQIEELMTEYGHMDMLWLDGGQVRPPRQDIRMAEMAEMARQHQPGLIIADRTVGGEYENIITPEQEIPDAPLSVPWESCITMGTGWAYRPNDTYKSARELIHALIDVTAKGGNLLLNIGPTPQGRLPEEALSRLHEIGDWMQINQEALHGTRPMPPYADGDLRFTRRGSTAYAIALKGAGADATPRTLALPGVTPAAGKNVYLLGWDDPLCWTVDATGVRIELPADASRYDHALVVKMCLEG